MTNRTTNYLVRPTLRPTHRDQSVTIVRPRYDHFYTTTNHMTTRSSHSRNRHTTSYTTNHMTTRSSICWNRDTTSYMTTGSIKFRPLFAHHRRPIYDQQHAAQSGLIIRLKYNNLKQLVQYSFSSCQFVITESKLISTFHTRCCNIFPSHGPFPFPCQMTPS